MQLHLTVEMAPGSIPGGLFPFHLVVESTVIRTAHTCHWPRARMKLVERTCSSHAGDTFRGALSRRPSLSGSSGKVPAGVEAMNVSAYRVSRAPGHHHLSPYHHICRLRRGCSMLVLQHVLSLAPVRLSRLLPLLLLGTVGVQAHGEEAPAVVAGVKAPAQGHEAYIQKHMASEHHISAFDLGSFFALHDLNRDGVWDRAEVEAIYGVHHSMSIKHSPTAEVHDEKANKIVKAVFDRLDKNGDRMISKSEFATAGVDGLPIFEEYGIGALGHHYDAESEFFVHHEEKYHNTPETQNEESYNHAEDLEHFRDHRRIEDEEEDRERKAEGLPSIAEEAHLRAEAAAKGEEYVSQWEQMQKQRPGDQDFHQVEQDGYFGGYAQDEAGSTQHVFKGPNGHHVVKSNAVEHASHEENVFEQLPGETDEGFQQRKELYDQRQQAAAYFDKLEKEQKARIGTPIHPTKHIDDLKQEKGESDEAYLRRVNIAKWEAGQVGQQKPVKDDRMRKGAPNKVSFSCLRLEYSANTKSAVSACGQAAKSSQEGIILWRILSTHASYLKLFK